MKLGDRGSDTVGKGDGGVGDDDDGSALTGHYSVKRWQKRKKNRVHWADPSFSSFSLPLVPPFTPFLS
ncbi:unnamed protein product [Brugia pahangi]|uniref:Uncharacterized protein n=1 Tax=Brugia pahangi TaxID=6280 RepID=A0A0N4TTH7_BRUPA|nr:unnamed protein product [Brugia pahangi]